MIKKFLYMSFDGEGSMTGPKVVSITVVVASLAMAGCIGASGPETVSTTFDDGTEGWTVGGDAQSGSVEPTHVADGGDDGGYVEATDDVSGGVWYWNASAAYLGDKSAYASGSLSFSLRQSSTDDQFDSPDVVLVSGETKLGYDFGNASSHPRTNWTAYSVELSAAGWTNLGTESAATDDEFERVLSDLDAVQIRGEYVTGDDVGGLDTVELAA